MVKTTLEFYFLIKNLKSTKDYVFINNYIWDMQRLEYRYS